MPALRCYVLHDVTDHRRTRTGLTLAACGDAMLRAASFRWRIVRGKIEHDEQGRPGRKWRMQTVHVAGHDWKYAAECFAHTAGSATKKLLELAAKFNYAQTTARHLSVAAPGEI